MIKLTAEACRAGRGILQWSMRDLASESGLSFTTIALFERKGSAREKTEKAILDAFSRHNVEITNGEGTGARLLFEK